MTWKTIKREMVFPELANYLGPQVGAALAATTRYATFEGARAVDIELLLCALYVVVGDDLLRFFDDPSKLTKLADEILPEAQRKAMPPPRRNLPAEMGIAQKVDGRVVELLWKAARIAIALGQKTISLEALVSALAIDDQALRELYEHRGLMLKGFLGVISQ